MPATPSGSTTSPTAIAVICIALTVGLCLAGFAHWLYCYQGRPPEGTYGAVPPIFLQLQSRLAKKQQQKLPTIHDLNRNVPMIKYKIWKSQNLTSSSPRSAALVLPNIMAVVGLSATLPQSPAKRPVYLPGEKRDQDQSSFAFYIKKVGRDSLASEDLENRVQYTCDAVDRSASDDTCAICLDVMEDDDSIRSLVCDHVFHGSCIDKWLMSHRAYCPVCKSNYKTPSSTV